MLRVLIVADGGMDMNLWAATLAAYKPDEVYLAGEIGADVAALKPFRGARVVPNAQDVTGDLVVFSPLRAERYPGRTSLAELRHPEDALYFFGPDNKHLTAEMIGREPDDVVHLECGGFDHMFAHVAGAIVLHAREVSRG